MHTMLYLVVILVVIVAIGAVVVYNVWPSSVSTGGNEIPESSSASGAREKQVNAASQQVSATQSSSTTAPVPNVSAEEKQKLIDAMMQKVQ